MNENYLPTVSEIADALQALTHSWRRRMRQTAQAIEPALHGGELRLIVVLGHHPGMTPKALAEVVGTDKAQLTRSLDRLVEQGWLERRAHPLDGRSRCLYLSDSGQALYARLRQAREAQAAQMLAGCDAGQMGELLAQLQALRGRLEA